MRHFIQKNTYQLAYQTFGTGDRVMLALHGYGQEASIYEGLTNAFPQHTIYSIDLFFHGQSEWHTDLDSLRKEHWREILDTFLVVNQIQQFDLLGFSMGGKVALVTTFLFAERISNLYLLAPDGIKINPWYSLATRFAPLQHLFKYFTHSQTDIYRRFAKKIGKLGLVHKSVLKLAEVEMSTPLKRKRVYQTWMLYRLLDIHLKEVARLINLHQINTFLIIGKYDKLIDEKTAHHFTHFLDKANLLMLDCGHHRLVATFCEIGSRNKDKYLSL